MKSDRRSFLFQAASLAAVPCIPSFIGRAHAANEHALLALVAEMDVQGLGDYERGSFKLFPANGNPLELSSEQARVGRRSLKVYLNRARSPSPFRTALTSSKNKLDFFKTHWFGFSIYVPADWQMSTTWEVLWQIHHHPGDWNGRNFSPVVALRIEENTDRWLIRQNYVQTPEGRQHESDKQTAFHTVLDEPIARGTWTDWVVEYRPDWRNRSDGGRGVTRWWRNGFKVIDYEGPNAVNNRNTHYLNFGVYKSAWKDRKHNDPVGQRLYYYDAVRVAKPDKGYYDLVAPGGAALPSAPRPPEIKLL